MPARCALAALLAILLAGCATPRPGATPTVQSLPDPASRAFPIFLESWLGVPAVPATRLEQLANGDTFLTAMLEAIQGARSDIRLEMYIFWSDATGQRFLDALAERARAGVRVTVLLDWLGSRQMSGKARSALEAAGVEVRRYHPGFFQTPGRLNQRDHRKFLLVDGRIGFTGGAGIARMWEGEGDQRRQWRDSMFVFEGPVVAEMTRVFDLHWQEVVRVPLRGAGPLENPDPQPSQAASPGQGAEPVGVQLVADGGGDARDPIYESYLLAIKAARKHVRLGMAYFVPDDRLCRALEEARSRGVSVEIVVPGGHMDSWPVTPASRKRWGRLLAAGVRLYAFQPAMYHAKILIVDDVWVCAGSANWDNRSLRLNQEANFHVQSPGFAAEAACQFEQDKRQSREVTLQQWRRRSVLKRLTEILIWPFEPLL